MLCRENLLIHNLVRLLTFSLLVSTPYINGEIGHNSFVSFFSFVLFNSPTTPTTAPFSIRGGFDGTDPIELDLDYLVADDRAPGISFEEDMLDPEANRKAVVR